MSEHIKEINAAEYESLVLQSSKPVVLDFYSTECPPCEALAPKFEALEKLYGRDVTFYKIFRQGNRELADTLGVKSSPTLLFFNGGKETGHRLTGGIKRSEIVAELNAIVGDARADEIAKSITPVTTDCDILILGGGPAGLTAGIYAAQAKLTVIVADIALPGGQVATTHMVWNFPGFPKALEGYMLAHYFQEQAKEAGVVFRAAAEVSDVNVEQKAALIDGYETIRAKKIIVATGSSPRPLGIPGEKEYKGKGISYCATCDAKYFDDKEVIVIGGGNSAVEESLFITKFAKRVRVVHQFATLQVNKEAQAKAFANEKIEFIFEHEPRKFERLEDGRMRVTVENLKTKELETLEADGVFVFVGMVPDLSLFNGHFERGQWGYLKTSPTMETNIAGVYAAGDVASRQFRQITTAVSDGTVAAIAASKAVDEGK